jgi:hypothetical protein
VDFYLETSREPAWGPPTVGVDIVPDAQLPPPVLWSFQEVFAGPMSSSLHGSPDTVGSDRATHEGFSFDGADLELRAFYFTVPDRRLDPALAAPWLQAPLGRGLPRLRTKESFGLDRVDGHVFLADGQHLFGLLEGGAAGRERVRVQIVADLSLLFQGGRYTGWMLDNPIAHVISPDGGDPRPSATAPVDDEVVSLFVQYYALLDEPLIERMQDEDPELREALVELLQRTGDDPVVHGPRFALRRQLVSMLASFYGEHSWASAALPP